MFNENAVKLWYRRMRYLNKADLKRLVNMSKEIVFTQKFNVRLICKTCNKVKLLRKVSKRVQYEVLEKLGKIHIDLEELINVPFINEAKYYMLLID